MGLSVAPPTVCWLSCCSCSHCPLPPCPPALTGVLGPGCCRVLEGCHDGFEVASLINQSMYLGFRCATIGADFRRTWLCARSFALVCARPVSLACLVCTGHVSLGMHVMHRVPTWSRVHVWHCTAALLTPVILQRLKDSMAGQLSDALTRFQEELHSGAWLQHVALQFDSTEGEGGHGAGAGTGPSDGSSGAGSSGAGGEDAVSPPRALLAFVPLADMLNALLALLNFLRQCMPVACGPSLAASLARHASGVVSVLVDVKQSRVGMHLHAPGKGAAADSGPKKFRALCEVGAQGGWAGGVGGQGSSHSGPAIVIRWGMIACGSTFSLSRFAVRFMLLCGALYCVVCCVLCLHGSASLCTTSRT